MRAMSTVIDVSLFLLLLSGSVVALSLQPTVSPQPPDAEAEARMLATSTTAVSVAQPTGESSIVRGTYAALLADAAVANLTGPANHGQEASSSRPIANAVHNATLRPTEHVAVSAVWQPYEAATLEGRVRTGPTPPQTKTVHTATLSVPSGLPDARQDAIGAAKRDGYSGVATVVSTAIVDGYIAPVSQFGPRRSDPAAHANRRRARRLATVLGTYIEDPFTNGEIATTRLVLREALEAQIEADIRNRFATPTAAAEAVSVGRVRLTITVWSA